MKKIIFALTLITLFILSNCNPQKSQDKIAAEERTAALEEVQIEAMVIGERFVRQEIDKAKFLLVKYRILETIYGDLNNDGKNDCVLIIQDTNKNNIIVDEYGGELDRNRRGIIIAFNTGSNYEYVMENRSCFSSGNEDEGIYFTPDLSVSIQRGNLYIHYSHGRYGYWQYTFRYRNSNFELIGYDRSENRGPITERTISINFLTARKQTKINTNENAYEDGQEVFVETWENIRINQIPKLSEIFDFDGLDFL